jgi:hypothetical protein
MLEGRAETLENGVAMTTEDGPRQGRGRPSRAEASRKALAGVDLRKLDPLDVLREIAADRSAPASARVAAAKELRVAEVAAKAAAFNKRLGF